MSHKFQKGFPRTRFARTLFLALSVFLILSTASVVNGQEGLDDRIARATATFNDAQDLHEQGALDEAIGLYRKALEIFEEFPEAHFQLGTALVQKGDSKSAESALRRAIELRPEWTLPILPLTRILFVDGRESEAMTLIDSGIELEPSNPGLLAEKTFVLLEGSARIEDLNAMLPRLTEVTRGANPAMSALLARAALELRIGKIEEASISVKRAVSLEPDNRNALRIKCEVELTAKDFVSAIEASDRLLASDKSDGTALVTKAKALIGLGRTNQAAELLHSTSTASKETRRSLSRIIAENTTDRQTMTRLLQDFPDDDEIAFSTCTSRNVLDADAIVSVCTRFLSTPSQRGTIALGSRATALLKLGRSIEALADFEKILTQDSGQTSAKAGRALALFNLERWEESRSSFEELTTASSEFPVAFYYLGIIYDRLARPTEALTNYETFLRVADRVTMSDEIGRTELRLSILRKQIKTRKN